MAKSNGIHASKVMESDRHQLTKLNVDNFFMAEVT